MLKRRAGKRHKPNKHAKFKAGQKFMSGVRRVGGKAKNLLKHLRRH